MKFLQRKAFVLATALMAGLASVSLRAETTSVNNGSNSATVTQSGDPSRTEKQILTRPGYTSIEQRNGGNSSVIIQRSNPGDSTPGDAETGEKPNTNPAPDEADGDDDRTSSLTDAEVYRQVRKGASSKSQQTLDNLMKSMGLQKKM